MTVTSHTLTASQAGVVCKVFLQDYHDWSKGFDVHVKIVEEATTHLTSTKTIKMHISCCRNHQTHTEGGIICNVLADDLRDWNKGFHVYMKTPGKEVIGFTFGRNWMGSR